MDHSSFQFLLGCYTRKAGQQLPRIRHHFQFLLGCYLAEERLHRLQKDRLSIPFRMLHTQNVRKGVNTHELSIPFRMLPEDSGAARAGCGDFQFLLGCYKKIAVVWYTADEYLSIPFRMLRSGGGSLSRTTRSLSIPFRMLPWSLRTVCGFANTFNSF